MIQLFKKSVKELYSPVIGKSIRLEEVNDKVFSEKMMGDGIAFQFVGNGIYAPCDAKVIMIASSKHAIGLKCGHLEILIHVGLETVNFNGQGLNLHVNVGDTVKRGDLLLTVDREFMEKNEVDLTTPMIITSTEKELVFNKLGEVDLSTKVIDII